MMVGKRKWGVVVVEEERKEQDSDGPRFSMMTARVRARVATESRLTASAHAAESSAPCHRGPALRGPKCGEGVAAWKSCGWVGV